MRERLLSIGAENIGIELLYGNPSKEILDRVGALCPSLVVIGTHGRRLIADIFVESVANNVVRNSNLPVHLVPMMH